MFYEIVNVFYHTITLKIVQIAIDTFNTLTVEYRHELFIFELSTVILQDEFRP